MTRDLALAARDIRWKHKVKPKDCVHVASALEAGCEVLYTHDEQMVKRSGKLGGTPPLKVEMPTWNWQIPLPEPDATLQS